MSGSTFGKLFKITTWGESHGRALGVTVDGCPAGLELCAGDIQPFLDRRKPGFREFATKRAEADTVEILSGVFDGRTTGTPISMAIFNNDARSRDYGAIKDIWRPGHADYGYDMKYGFRDYRGGGRSSGRETAGRVAGGAVACLVLARLGVSVTAYTCSVGGVSISRERFDVEEIAKNPLAMPDCMAYEEAAAVLRAAMERGDSVGSVVECAIAGLPPGVGEPVFDKLDAILAHAVMSIGGVKGIEFGAGFCAAESTGSVNNDPFYIESEKNSNEGLLDGGRVAKRSNNSGGVMGGLSDGADIVFRAAFKPTPSIARRQETVNNRLENVQVEIAGRHDPVIAPRAAVVVECMAAAATLDLMLQNMLSNIDGIVNYYTNSF